MVMKYRVLNGSIAKNPCAYCKLHRVSLTVKQVKYKKCIEKKCNYFNKYSKHPFWN